MGTSLRSLQPQRDCRPVLVNMHNHSDTALRAEVNRWDEKKTKHFDIGAPSKIAWKCWFRVSLDKMMTHALTPSCPKI